MNKFKFQFTAVPCSLKLILLINIAFGWVKYKKRQLCVTASKGIQLPWRLHLTIFW
jgi:hypothetical protein